MFIMGFICGSIVWNGVYNLIWWLRKYFWVVGWVYCRCLLFLCWVWFVVLEKVRIGEEEEGVGGWIWCWCKVFGLVSWKWWRYRRWWWGKWVLRIYFYIILIVNFDICFVCLSYKIFCFFLNILIVILFGVFF